MSDCNAVMWRLVSSATSEYPVHKDISSAGQNVRKTIYPRLRCQPGNMAWGKMSTWTVSTRKYCPFWDKSSLLKLDNQAMVRIRARHRVRAMIRNRVKVRIRVSIRFNARVRVRFSFRARIRFRVSHISVIFIFLSCNSACANVFIVYTRL